MSKVRKSIDIPEKEFKKIQLLALKKGISIKQYIEKVISESIRVEKNIKLVTE